MKVNKHNREMVVRSYGPAPEAQVSSRWPLVIDDEGRFHVWWTCRELVAEFVRELAEMDGGTVIYPDEWEA